mmetsp:Transcript_28116/g.29309  ORF Transcript_28116/g.29309 Transcript_28116/m.29309 type:complete len:251 (-) Transcript_28116:29-781(-)
MKNERTSTTNTNSNIYGDMKFRGSTKKVDGQNLNNTATVSFQTNNQNQNSGSNYNMLLSNNNSNINLKSNNFKDFTYNEEFYTTLNKNLVLPIIDQTGASRLLNLIDQNHNASVSTTTGQFITALEDIRVSTDENKGLIENVKGDIKRMGQDIQRLPVEVKEDYQDDIVSLKDVYNKYLVDQKRENIKLQREVNQYQKENIDIQNEIYYLLGRLNSLEKEVGFKARGYAYYEENLINNDETRYIIKTEFI